MRTVHFDAPITALAFHPGGNTLVYGGESGPQGIPDTGVRFVPITGVTEFGSEPIWWPSQPRMTGLAFTPDGTRLVGCSGRGPAPGLATCWEFARQTDRWQLVRAEFGLSKKTPVIAAVAAGNDHAVLITHNGVITCRLPDGTAGEKKSPPLRRPGAVAAAPAGDLIGGADGERVLIWRMTGPSAVAECVGHTGRVEAIAFAPDGAGMATGGRDGTVIFWDPATGRQSRQLDPGLGPIHAVAYAPDGLTLAVAGSRGLVVVDVG